MKFSTATVAAFAALLPTISAHLIMTTPTQWFVAEVIGPSVELSQGQQNPLLADGSNFPCPGVPPSAPVATYEPGSTQTLQIVGSAVHGGGSGQMSITYDTKPSASSKFRVMTSWMGDHPIKADGNLTPNAAFQLPALSFKVPAGLPAGNAVVAWTWFNRLGNREMYMKCASITIGGSETSTAAFDALPEMFRGNSGNGCAVPEGIQAISFKNPGPQTFGTGTQAVACDNTQPGTGTGSGTPSESSPVVSKPATTKTGSPTGPTPTPIVEDPEEEEDPEEPETPVVPTPVVPTPVTPSQSAKPSKTYGGKRPGKSAAPVPSSSAPAPTAAPGAATPCVEGKVTCNPDGTWSLCGSGYTQNMGLVSPGMTCSNGEFSKRSIRFSHAHRRRHIRA